MKAMNNESKSPSATQLSKPSPVKTTRQRNPDPIETFTGQASSLERTLINALRPPIQNELTLTPTRYQTLLDEAHCNMAMQAQYSNVLTKGAALLVQEQDLRRMLNIQRTLLIGV
jgi:hypothetical protein